MTDAPVPFARPRERPGQHPPPLVPFSRPQVGSGSFDRIALHLTGFVFIADMDALRRRARTEQTLFALDGQLPPDTIAKLKIQPGWHLEGSIRFPGVRGSNGARRYRFEADIDLNFSRFANQAARAEDWRSPGNMRLDPSLSAATRRKSFDGNDNLVEGNAFARLAHPGAVVEALNVYLSLALDLLRTDLCTLAASTEYGLQPPTVRQAEVYWEYYSQRSKQDAAYYGRQIDIGAASGNRSEYSNDLVGYTRRVKSDVAITTYAKTATRVRFEVRYTKAISRSARARGNSPLERLLAARDDAARRLTRATKSLCDDNSSSLPPRSALVDVLRRLNASCGRDQNALSLVLDVFLDRSSVSALGTLPEHIITRLLQEGVLKRSNARNANPYELVPFAEWVFHRLASAFPAERVPGWASDRDTTP